MQLARVLFAGALLFGVGCEASEEGEPETGRRIDPINAIDGEEGCTLDIVRLTDEQVEELQEILNTAIDDDELVFARLAPDQLARVQVILSSAIVPAIVPE
jgi:hypothetical protein